MNQLPRWDLDSIYPGTDNDQYTSDLQRLKKNLNALTEAATAFSKEANETGLLQYLECYNETGDLFETLISYIYCLYSTDTANEEYIRQLNTLEAEENRIKEAGVIFRTALGKAPDKQKWLNKSAATARYRFFLAEENSQAEHQMSQAEENLAAELSLHGGSAWGRLQETLSSQHLIDWKKDEKKTLIQLRALAFDSDPEVRKAAFEKELEGWKEIETPLAFALNGVKGFTHTLNSRRKYETTLQKSAFQARLGEETLNTMIEAMEKSLPAFRRYFSRKAEMLGKKKLAFYDIFAPVASSPKKWSYDEAKEIILETFDSFSTEMGDFGRKAFDENWIDPEPRAGKVGGAYCISFPDRKNSRILSNFDGSFQSVSTLAHELGHAWHHEVLRNSLHNEREYPMTLAETASIFSETLLGHRALEQADENEKRIMAEAILQDASQVIVDILSRFYFEKDIMRIRTERELSASEFNSLMINAQKKTYGEALEVHHPYMWAVKGHYYSQDLAFYNFPYAFGQLFGTGLYSLYKSDAVRFVPLYNQILLKTGSASAEDVAAGAGFDIRKKSFWESGLKELTDLVSFL